MKFLRADDEIDVRHQLKQFRAARLRHAAKKTEDYVRPALRHATEHSHFAQRLLLRHVAHTAGVEEHDIGLEFVRGSFVATIEQRARDLFRVPLVHLATVGFDEKFRHSRGPTIHKCARLAISGTPQSLGRNGEAVRKGICLQALLPSAIAPREVPASVEDRDADRLRLAILFLRVRSQEIITFPSVAPFE